MLSGVSHRVVSVSAPVEPSRHKFLKPTGKVAASRLADKKPAWPIQYVVNIRFSSGIFASCSSW
jgi:hypothetical protein